MYPWSHRPPRGTFEIKPQEDIYLTLEKWPKEAFDEHYHDAFNWLVPMRPGEVVVEVGKEEFRLDSNHWLCIFPNTPHEVKSVSDGVEVMSLFLSHKDMHAALGHVEISKDRHFIIGGKGTIAQGLALQWAESRLPESEGFPLRAAFTKFLCAWIWSFYGKTSRSEATPELMLKLKLDDVGLKTWRFIENNIGESSFPWEVLAQDLDMSLRTYQRLLAKKMNLTPSELLTTCRVELSKRELRDPDIELADIALRVGFSSQSHFSTVFKAHVGTSPSQFRAQAGKIGT